MMAARSDEPERPVVTIMKRRLSSFTYDPFFEYAYHPSTGFGKSGGEPARLEIGEIVIVPDLVAARQAVSSQAFGQSGDILGK